LKVPVKIYKARLRFEKEIAEERVFVGSLINLSKKSSNNRYYPLSKNRREKLCESSFLILFTSWEDFLEFTFEHFLVLGNKCDPPVKLKIYVNSLDVAHEIICGDRNYVDWVMASDVNKRAKIYFEDGEPFQSAMDLSKKDLEMMRVLRNEIAHRSAHSQKIFKTMVRKAYGSAQKTNAGEFLLSTLPSSFTLPGSTKQYSSIFDYFADILLSTGIHIVPDRL
jgi:hypothetical protein